MATTYGPLVLPLLLLATALHGGARAQDGSAAPRSAAPATGLSPGPAAAVDCMSVLVDKLSACLTYVEEGSKAKRPEKECCGGLASVVGEEPLCLCPLLSSSDVYGIKIDRTRALTLPRVCKVKTPPVSRCPAGAPAPTPVASTPGAVPAASPAAEGPGGAPGRGGGRGGAGPRSPSLVYVAGFAILAVGVF